jgi:hypothetical protein
MIRLIFSQMVLSIEAQYLLATHLTKISILLFYRRLSSGTFAAWFVWAIRAMIVVVTLSFVGLNVTLFNACKPFDAFWNQVDFGWAALNKYVCYDEGAGQYATIVSGAFQDLVVCLIPMVLIMKLPLPRRQKVALFGLFSLGLMYVLLECASMETNGCRTFSLAIFRSYYIFKVYYDSYDVTWWAGPAFLLAGIEASMGITCASMPALKFYFSAYFNETDSSRPFRGIGNWSIKMTNWTKSHRPSATSKDMTTTSVSSMWRNLSGDVSPDGERHASESKLGFAKDPEDSWPGDLELGGIAVTREVEVVASSLVFPQWPLPPARHPVGPYTAPFGGGGGRTGCRPESVLENETPSWLDDSSVHELEWMRSGGR